MDEIRNLLAALVRGEGMLANWPATNDPLPLYQAALHHGLIPLVADRIGAEGGVPLAFGERIREESRRHAAADMLREAELRLLLGAMASARVEVLVVKGVHLAYSAYARPDLRPRVDTDLLVRPQACATASAVLLELGYGAPRHTSGHFVSYQAQNVKRRDGMVLHAVDLHWRIANPQVFAAVLSFEELRSASVPLARLHPTARAPSSVHALLLACVHRVAHHFDSDRLIWLYDIHLLASAATRSEWQEFSTLAVDRGVAAVCCRSLERAAECFRTHLPGDVMDTLRIGAATRADEPTVAYLLRDRRPVTGFLADARALPGWSARWQLTREHLFPPRQYMRDVYAPASCVPLPALYTWRIIRGALKWLKRA